MNGKQERNSKLTRTHNRSTHKIERKKKKYGKVDHMIECIFTSNVFRLIEIYLNCASVQVEQNMLLVGSVFIASGKKVQLHKLDKKINERIEITFPYIMECAQFKHIPQQISYILLNNIESTLSTITIEKK